MSLQLPLGQFGDLGLNRPHALKRPHIERKQELKIRMFVNGQAMSGGSISHGLRAATFVGPVTTAPRYRFFSVRDEFPGLYPDDENGASIAGELYEAEYSVVRAQLLPLEPEELELTLIELSDGSGSLSMRMREDRLAEEGVTEITQFGGWLAYKATADDAEA